MSKAHFPHWRYIALRLHGDRPVSRRAMQNAITGRGRKEGVADDDLPQLTRYAWPHAIVRVHHHQLAAARDWLPRVTWAVQEGAKVPFRLETLSSSGTIKTLTDRVGFLRERGQPKGAMRKAKSGTQAPRGAAQRPRQASDWSKDAGRSRKARPSR